MPGAHPALVAPELFDRVQEASRKRQTAWPPALGMAGFPLRGLARCATCGGFMGIDRHQRWSYYRCSRRAYQRQRCASGHCNSARMHGSFERICASIIIDGSRTLADV